MTFRTLYLLMGALAPLPVLAQSAVQLTSPVGSWTTVDDKSGAERGMVRIVESHGQIYGQIERIYDKAAEGKTCEKCTDDRRNKPILGLEVIRGLHSDPGGGWSGGEILDPETGDTYRVTMRLADDGRKLIVRGSVLGGLIGRSQTWLRKTSG